MGWTPIEMSSTPLFWGFRIWKLVENQYIGLTWICIKTRTGDAILSNKMYHYVFSTYIFIGLIGVQSNMIHFVTLHGFSSSGFDIYSNMDHVKLIYRFLTKFHVLNPQKKEVELVVYWGSPCGYVSIGGSRGWKIWIVSFILIVLLSKHEKKSKFNFE